VMLVFGVGECYYFQNTIGRRLLLIRIFFAFSGFKISIFVSLIFSIDLFINLFMSLNSFG
jgi:hypothetical protein